MEKAAFKAYFSGMVQGVGYRYFAYTKATSLGVTGYVKNLSDGRVEVFAEGEKDRLSQFLRILKEGPRWGVVENTQVEWGIYQGKHDQFGIESRHGF